MRYFKFSKAFGLQLLVLIAFTAIAMGSSSNKEANDAFWDGYERGYNAFSEATDVETISVDSCAVIPGDDMAINY